jgi:hypothetical protein
VAEAVRLQTEKEAAEEQSRAEAASKPKADGNSLDDPFARIGCSAAIPSATAALTGSPNDTAIFDTFAGVDFTAAAAIGEGSPAAGNFALEDEEDGDFQDAGDDEGVAF